MEQNVLSPASRIRARRDRARCSGWPAMMFCCICHAYGDERPEDVLNAGGVPLCYEHNANINEQSRKPQQPRVVTFPRTADEDYSAKADSAWSSGSAVIDRQRLWLSTLMRRALF